MYNQNKPQFKSRDNRDNRDNRNGRGNNPRYRNNDRHNMSAKDCEIKFNYNKLAEELLEKDDIRCSSEIIDEICEHFEDMGGEEGLKDDLLCGIIANGFENPSKIQTLTIPQIIKGRDLLAQSQSGTGKTGAFVISALQVIDTASNFPQAIILSPTCELAQQTYIVSKSISNFMKNLKISFTVGGSDRNNNITELGGDSSRNDEVSQLIIATPGRLVDLITEFPILFEHIKLLIVDECDELLSGTFKEDLKQIIQSLSENVQICFFSATLTNEVVKLSDIILKKDHVKILIKKEKITLDGIKQTYIDVQNDEQKQSILIEMLSTLAIQQFIVYVNSKKTADILKTFLEEENVSALTITGDYNKYERAEIITQFKKGGIKCLIATDLLSRGIDIQQLSLVINYDLPRADNIQSYIHRIGRTGRFGKKGLSINLVTRYEKDVQNLIALTFKCQILPLQNNFLSEI